MRSIFLIACASFAYGACDVPDSATSPVEDVGSGPAPSMVLHHTEDPSQVGPAFVEIAGSVPVMYGPQGGGANLPFAAVVHDSLFNERVDIHTEVAYPTGESFDVRYLNQKLRPQDPDSAESAMFLWSFVALLPDAFEESDIVELSLNVTLSDSSGTTLSEQVLVRVQWHPMGSE